MKDFFIDTVMLIVGCVLWSVTGAIIALGFFGAAAVACCINETGNWNLLWWFCLIPVEVAIVIGFGRFSARFWSDYCG